MKKLISIALVIAMLFAFGVTALATETEEAEETETTYTITINNSTPGYTYQAYQIFTGDLDDEGVLSNIEWGKGVNGGNLLAALKDDDDFLNDEDENVFEDCTSAAMVAAVLSEQDDNSAFLNNFADAVSGNLTTTKTESNEFDEENEEYTISGLSAGYYIVKNSEVPDTTGTAYTDFILKVVKDTTASQKGDVPSVIKKVKDINDSSTSGLTGWQDSADHDIGDTVYYKLEGTLPTNYAEYKQYKYVFTDTISAGLTYNSDDDVKAKVYVVNYDDEEEEYVKTDITTKTGVSVSTAAYDGEDAIYEDGNVLTVSIANLKALTGVTIDSDSLIVVEYSCTLNEDAVIGADGNPNEVYLEYSNNPNQASGGTPDTGYTPVDKVIVFTYEISVDKVAQGEDGLEPLAGAGFTLYKLIPLAENETYTKIEGVPDPKEGFKWVIVGSEVIADEGEELTTFVWTGIDDGDYCLVESTTPNGYNTMTPKTFTVSATHDVLDDDPELTELTTTLTGFTATKSTGVIDGDIENVKGTTLPETGGIGTTIFYIVGAILVIGAAVLLITKKRMSN
ncbi:MAG: isopeptide-forming domain-containing fimbrial protein [Oscillospiraceae bacterium]|nr:isopeptide-forming domain-containing fimbrial protein [Oscillospiraceae bacterium]